MKNTIIKQNKLRRPLLCAFLALSLLILAGCGTTVKDGNLTETVSVTRALRFVEDVAKGEPLRVTSIELVELDENSLPAGYLADPIEATGRILSEDAKAGDFVLESMLVDNKSETDDETITEDEARAKGYIVVTDYFNPMYTTDASGAIQKIIDDHPRSTIFFPDGRYPISKPILTSSDPEKAVSLQLSTFAIIKAASNWDDANGYMIQLGAKDSTAVVTKDDVPYVMSGGCIDGSSKARGVEVTGGLSVTVEYVSMKFVTNGLRVALNDDSGSAVAEIHMVNMVGLRLPGSIGLLVDSNGGTFTNMRVASFEVGTKVNGKNNTLRNLHMLFVYATSIDYRNSVGFWDTSEGNYYEVCYPDNFAIGFRTSGHTVSEYHNCYAYWYSSREGEMQYGFSSDGQFHSIIKGYRVDLVENKDGRFMTVGEAGGTGIVEYPSFPEYASDDDTYKDYLVGKVIWMY